MIIPSLSSIVAYAKRYGFIYPSSEIYERIQAIYDYGPLGIALKRNLQNYWWKSMTQLHSNIVGLDAAILMHPTTWEASGHLAGFHDWMVDHKESQKRYRVDVLVENKAEELKAAGAVKAADALLSELKRALQAGSAKHFFNLLVDHQIVCPLAKTVNWTEVKQFNLMFATEIGATAGHSQKIYLRPETAQGIFVNFLSIQKSMRLKLPFGVAQIGKSFRNEIIARQFIFRMREFEQMEMQFFIPPNQNHYFFTLWLSKRQQWYKGLGIPIQKQSVMPHQTLAHYAIKAVDITYQFPFGNKEVEGIHARGDFDLRQHQHYAKKKLTYFDPKKQEHYLPSVIETSCGVDRLLLMLLSEHLKLEVGEKKRSYLALPAPLAPLQAALLPLVKKDELPQYAHRVWQQYRNQLILTYDETGSIGKRYVRQDLIGTPYCITIDHQTLLDDTVTVRERDTMHQERMTLSAAVQKVVHDTCDQRLLEQLSY